MNDTIVALATPPGTSALAVIRISGPECRNIWRRHLSKNEPKVRKAQLLPFRSPIYQTEVESQQDDFSWDQSEIVDRLLALYFEGPKSFTGEDSIEIYPHGNMLLVRKIIQTLTHNENVRLAEPGEFTRRAFEHGQIDLVQAESIGMLIHSKNELALENAQKLLHGELSEKISELVSQVRFLSAKMELEVDFAEEEADAELQGWSQDIIVILELIDQLKQGHLKNRKNSEVPWVVFYGKPNAGKSSLINALLEEDRLLVSNQAGTTRDYIETSLFLEGGEIRLVDTAGLGDAIDDLDAMSQEKTKQILEKAVLRIHLVEASEVFKSEKIDSENFQIESQKFDSTDWLCFSKTDLLEKSASPSPLNDVMSSINDHSHDILKYDQAIQLSSQSLQGIADLKEKLNDHLFKSDEIQEEVWMASERQYDCLLKSEDFLRNGLDILSTGGASPEILAFELREARLALEEITGEISVDSILGRIFEGFCIGK